MWDWKKYSLIAANVIFILALIAVAFPLLVIAKYNYPSADDWSFSLLGYHALKNGEGLIGVLRAATATSGNYYASWEGRFCNSFLAALQPGIWGERCYGTVAWLMIGSIILSELYLCGSLLKKYAENKGRWLSIPIVAPSLMLQLLYTPAPEESFYWYTGAVNYTFVYGLSLVLLVLFVKIGMEEYKNGGARFCLTAVACVLAVIVGGDNYSTSLSCFLAMLVLSALFFLFDRRAFWRTWFVTALEGICLGICLLAPGNRMRLNANFGGETGSAVGAIAMSLQYCFRMVYYQCIDVKVLLLFLLILPFLWKAGKAMDYSFRFPALFTLTTFCLYASQAAPNMYVEGGMYTARLNAIIFYSCHVWLVGNVGYWVGWISRRENRATAFIERMVGRLEKYLLVYCAVFGILLAGIIYRFDLRSLTSYRAYRSWRQGWAKQYAKEWEERLEVLHDDGVKEVSFAPISVDPDLIMYTDLQGEGGLTWVNDACAEYYDKDFIRVAEAEQ